MDIVSLPPEIQRDKIDSRYRLVIMASQRAKALALGANTDLASASIKFTTRAIEEALENQLEVVTGEAAREARQEALKEEARRLAAEAEKREEMGVELSELEKDLKFYLNEKEEKERKAIEDLFSAPEGEEAAEDTKAEE